jgi:hypothetical protein
VRVLLRGGLRAAEEAEVAGVVDMDAAGEGVEVSDISSFKSSFCMPALMGWRNSAVQPCWPGSVFNAIQNNGKLASRAVLLWR